MTISSDLSVPHGVLPDDVGGRSEFSRPDRLPRGLAVARPPSNLALVVVF
jgi:hypothetical protein